MCQCVLHTTAFAVLFFSHFLWIIHINIHLYQFVNGDKKGGTKIASDRQKFLDCMLTAVISCGIEDKENKIKLWDERIKTQTVEQVRPQNKWCFSTANQWVWGVVRRGIKFHHVKVCNAGANGLRFSCAVAGARPRKKKGFKKIRNTNKRDEKLISTVLRLRGAIAERGC